MAKLICLPFLLIIFLYSVIVVSASSTPVINEILPTPQSGNDWVELYNPGEEDIDVSGWILDDEGTSTDMLKIPDNTTISSKAFELFYVGNRLNKDGDTLYLKNGQLQIDKYEYKSSQTDVSLGRYPDGSENWTTCQPTPQGANTGCEISKEPDNSTSDNNNSTPSPKAQATSAKTPKASPSQTPILQKPAKAVSSSLPRVLGKSQSSTTNLLTSPNASPSASAKPIEQEHVSPSKIIIAGVLTGAGIVLIGASAAFYFWYYRVRGQSKSQLKNSPKV